MQDKTINRALQYLHSECMNGRAEGKDLVLALAVGSVFSFSIANRLKHEGAYQRWLALRDADNKLEDVVFVSVFTMQSVAVVVHA